MPVKDKIMGWFIKNILIPRMEIIDHPGFIILRFTDKGKEVYLRELFFPESLLVELERNVVRKYGEKGKQALYSIGKTFGYRYTLISRYPTIKEVPIERINQFIYYFLKYMEGTCAHKLDYTVDVSRKKYTMIMDDYIVCGKDGIGLIMSAGGSAGVWSYMMDDPHVEGIELKCQGRGDKKCMVICAPKNVLLEENLKFFEESNLENLDLAREYVAINKIKPTKFAKLSLRNLLDTKFFSSFLTTHNYSRCSIVRSAEIVQV